MFRLFITIFILCTHNANGADKEIFDRNVDDIFESIIGDPHELKLKMIERGRTYQWYKQTLPPNISAIFNSDINLNHTYIDDIITTTTQKHMPITPAPDVDQIINTSLSYHKFRLKKLEITRLLKETGSPLPNFAKDEDNPAHITRRFDKLRKESDQTNTLFRREIYFDYMLKYGDHHRIYAIKTKMRDIMLHFIYVTRYKLPYMQLLRKKYKGLYKYQIGYCFALLRHLRQQQKNLFSALMDYYKMMNNLLFHMKIYEKVVRLDVDIRDVCKLIKVLNYKRNLDDDPTYYDDTAEIVKLPPAHMGGPRGVGPSGQNVTGNEQGAGYPGPGDLPPGAGPPGAGPPGSGQPGGGPPGGGPPGGGPPGGGPPGGGPPGAGPSGGGPPGAGPAGGGSPGGGPGRLPPGGRRFPGRRAIIAPKAASLSRRALTPTRLAQSAIRADTRYKINKRHLQPPHHGYPMPFDQKPYRIQEMEIKSMSPMTLPPQLLKNGRRLYAPLPDGMRL